MLFKAFHRKVRNATCGGQGGEQDDVGEGDDSAVKAYKSWQPNKAPIRTSREEGETPTASDIIATLISIYGSKELFINEYRCGLAW